MVPESPSRMIQTPKGNILLKSVDELIDPETHSWDKQLIRDIFNPIDVARILRIPVNGNMTEDFIAWHLTKTYSFSVWSAYYAQWNHTFGRRINRSGQGPSSRNP